MGWIVYERESGQLIKYYKKAATAKGIVTSHNKEREYDLGTGFHYRYRPDNIWDCCDYRLYEGVLMGLRGDALKMWQFCNQKPDS